MKIKNVIRNILACVFFVNISVVNAALITPSSITGTGSFSNDVNLIIDGVVPAETTPWTAASNVYWTGTNTSFTIDLGDVYTIEDVLISVDNNDAYNVEYSLDNSSWTNLFTLFWYYGEIGWGMDTMTSDSSSAEYVSQLDFAAVDAQYLRVFSTSGDNFYSIGELQAFGSLSTPSNPIAAPPTWVLFGLGLLGLLRNKRGTNSSKSA